MGNRRLIFPQRGHSVLAIDENENLGFREAKLGEERT